MLVFIDLVILKVVISPELGVTSSHRVGGFQQIVAKETVAGLNEAGVLGLKLTGLMLFLDKTGIFGDRSLRLETANISDFSDDTGRVDLADAGNGSQCVGNDSKYLFNLFIKNLDLLFQRPHGGNANGHGLINGIVHCFWQAVRASGSSLDGFGGSLWIGKAAMTSFADKSGESIQISVSQLVHSLKAFHKSDGSGAGVCYVLVPGETGAFQKQIVAAFQFYREGENFPCCPTADVPRVSYSLLVPDIIRGRDINE